MSDNLLTITQDDLKAALGHKRPVIVYFYDGAEKTDKPLENALQSVARKNAEDLVVARVDVNDNRRLYNQYGPLATPALVTLVKGFLGHKVKSEAEAVRPKDVRAHADYLLERGPEPTDDNEVAERPAATAAAKQATKAVTDRTFKKDVLKANTPVLVDFWAPWCAPCQTIAPFMEEIAREYRGRVRIAKLNVDDNPATKNSYQIMSIPTLIMFKDGEPIERRTGANAAIIRAMIDEALLA